MDFKLIKSLIIKSFPFIKPYMFQNILAILLNQIAMVSTLLIPLAIQYLVDDVLISQKYDQLVLVGIAMCAMYLVGNVLSFLSNYIYAQFAETIVIDARNALYERLLDMKMSFFTKEKIGDIVTRLKDDVGEIHTLLSFVLDNILINVVKILVIFIILFRMNFTLALMAVITIPIFMGLNKYFSVRMRNQTRKTRQYFSDLVSFFINSFSKIILVKNFCCENQELSKHNKLSGELKRSMILAEIFGYLLSGITALVVNFSSVLILWVGGIAVIKKTLTIGELIAFYTYLKQIYDPILNLTVCFTQINRAVTGMERYFSYYERVEIENKGAGAQVNLKGDILLQDVDFKYNDETQIFENLTLDIRSNEKVLLLGKSGQGKTTLSYLLKSFYQPTQGQIRIDGMDINEINLTSLRMNIGYLPQEAFILDGTVRDNLKCVKLNATDEEMWEALEKAEIADVVRTQLRNGLDDDLGMNGSCLSGGQKQRISIARLFLQNPNIIFFDELLTGLDSETETRVWNNIKTFVKDKTIFFITHKVIDPQFFDSIYVLENKKLIKYPSYQDVVEKLNLTEQQVV